MMRGTITVLSFISTVLFPWPFTVLLVFAVSFFEPLLPFATGLFADTLYYMPQTHTLPLFTFYGALATAIAFFVRSRLSAGIIRQ